MSFHYWNILFTLDSPSSLGVYPMKSSASRWHLGSTESDCLVYLVYVWLFRQGLLRVRTPCMVHGWTGWLSSVMASCFVGNLSPGDTWISLFISKWKASSSNVPSVEMIGIIKSTLLTMQILNFVLCAICYLEVESWGSSLGLLLLRYLFKTIICFFLGRTGNDIILKGVIGSNGLRAIAHEKRKEHLDGLCVHLDCLDFLQKFVIVISRYGGTLQNISVKLPITLNKFFQPTEMAANDFFQRWKQLSK